MWTHPDHAEPVYDADWFVETMRKFLNNEIDGIDLKVNKTTDYEGSLAQLPCAIGAITKFGEFAP